MISFWNEISSLSTIYKYHIYRVIQRSVPPSTAKLGNAAKNPRVQLGNIGKNTLFAKKNQGLTSNIQDFRAFWNGVPIIKKCDFLYFSRFLNFGPFLMFESGKKINDVTKLFCLVERNDPNLLFLGSKIALQHIFKQILRL